MKITRSQTHSSGLDTSKMSAKVHRNYDHVWGSYLEWMIGQKLLIRIVRVYGYKNKPNQPGARNSIHCHHTTEWVMGISGTTRCYVGESIDKMKPYDLKEGDVVESPANWPHCVEYIGGQNSEDDIPFSEFVEIMAGENYDGTYEIKRFKQAIVADHPINGEKR